MNGTVRATNRVINAIQTADAIPRNQVNKMPGNSAPPSAAGAGFIQKWAKVTTATDMNNYTCNIYIDREDVSTPDEENKQVRVWDIVDELIANDWIPVKASTVTGEDYECIQQMGAVG